jgi:ATP-dependent DNA helicase RecQ
MTSFGLHELQALVDSDLTRAVGSRASDGLAERIRQVLGDRTPEAKLFDLPPLIRQFLLKECQQRGGEPTLRVPKADDWPSKSIWESHCCVVRGIGSEYLIAPQRWTPDWLDDGTYPVFADAFSETSVRTDARCGADPFIAEATGFKFYSCPGQREAVRATFLMRPGDTLIVNLPTGSGKSLAGHAPALVGRRGDQLTVFVVPTIALAIDQERQFQASLDRRGIPTYPLAWHGSTAPEVRNEIRHRLRNAAQRILFVSPEALLGSLLPIISESAEAGHLSHLVIDEAHLVSQWGDGFRPAFQALSGLRNSLIRRALKGREPRTLLLSATFSQETIETLSSLFGPPDCVQTIAAVHLRPEPQYWFYKAASGAEKRQKVLEALRHAPRPFILYVTTRTEARNWMEWLHQAGLRRIARFDGEVSSQREQNERVLRLWAENALDGIVATSAFGVGIDKADVRSIIHATVPETLDRFYQEVGRGGRDGCPSVSLLVHEARDWALPKRLASRKIVSEELGLERWQAMYSTGVDVEDGLRRIDLRSIRRRLPADSEYNNAWNLRTLLLLCRAGLIELDIRAQEALPEDAVAEYFAPIWQLYVRIKDYSHMNPATWIAKVRPIRARSIESGARSLDLLGAVLDGTREVSGVLADLYTVQATHMDIHVVAVCGGCPMHRGPSDQAVRYRPPVATPIYRVVGVDRSQWTLFFPHLVGPVTYVFYQRHLQAIEAKILAIVAWLVRTDSVREVATPSDSVVTQGVRWRGLYKYATDGVLIHRDIDDGSEEPYSPLGRVTIFDRCPEGDALAVTSQLVRPFHVIIMPADSKDPNNGYRPLIDTTLIGIRLDDLFSRIAQ